MAVLGAAAGLERHDALDLDARALVLHPHLVGQRQQVLQPVVAGAQHLDDLRVRQRHPALEHLLARDVEDVGPGHLCRHVPDCCVCRALASRCPDRRSAGTATSLDCAHGEHLDTDAAPRRRAAVRTGQRLPDPPRAGLLARRRVGPHQPGLDLLRARDPRARRAPRSVTRSPRAAAGSPSTRRPRRGASEFQRLFAEAVRTHDRGSARGFTTALSLAPLVTREVFLGLLSSGSRRSTPCSPRGRPWPRRRPTCCRRTCPPLIALWNAQGRTERAWLVDMVAGARDRRRVVRRRAGRLGAAGRRPGLGHAGRPRALPPGPRPHRLTAPARPRGECGQVVAGAATSALTAEGPSGRTSGASAPRAASSSLDMVINVDHHACSTLTKEDHDHRQGTDPDLPVEGRAREDRGDAPSTASTSTSPRARSSPSSARTAPARRPRCASSPPCSSRPPARRRSRATTSPPRPRTCAAASATSRRPARPAA